MTILYFILTAILSSVVTFNAPALVARYRQFKTRKQQKLVDMVREEVERQLKDIIND
jgi:hypothetical protein